ncbi:MULTISPECIES: arsenic resistance protein [Halomonas]|uniref:arsenic resistance protein n=1 Tax=Halomonas TaxID=2745 RepID=UPI001C95C8E6|nr:MULTISPECIES: arsenic resistance protein [Halomonas]MBY6208951.1 arsenic resistance protein [Halomonas sp. DP3Y7-2]MBY6227421.1 arsenic resistance protein [Halomonas sp. DP3Y7-1]MCA0914829.1 arsenic resistance protein [Halomonas denitrificans]
MLTAARVLAACGTTGLLLGGMVSGATIGHYAPSAGQWLGDGMDATLRLLIVLLLLGVRFGSLFKALRRLRFLGVAILANFVLIPAIGYCIASLFLGAHPLLMVGLAIYFMSPCTDWFLGFTRLADGDVTLGTALIPINMLAQLLLYPFFVFLFTRNVVEVDNALVGSALLQWFVLPLALALAARHALRLIVGGERLEHLLAWSDRCTPLVLALLVAQIFADNIGVILEHGRVFIWLLLAAFTFFVVTFLLGEAASRLARLPYPEHALLTMTTAARNAPLMLAVTMVALPGQPLVYAAIVIGMLLEFPHLALLRYLLLRSRRAFNSVAVNSGPIT